VAFYKFIKNLRTSGQYLVKNLTARISFKNHGRSSSASITNCCLLIGSQFNLGKSVVIDWWIVGPHYDSGSGTLNGVNSEPFSAIERSELQTELNELDLPFVDETTEVSAQDIKVLFSGPWGGVRAGLSLGVRF